MEIWQRLERVARLWGELQGKHPSCFHVGSPGAAPEIYLETDSRKHREIRQGREGAKKGGRKRGEEEWRGRRMHLHPRNPCILL